ncbi:peptidase S24-like domain protein [Candidatus Rickettsiella viridis]|uniref:Peptidase S24-like domain protein n=1 Tax=Candidatus Rickettsiella viridis TaxID=676208 RepID=A0A2Z5UUI4_9COXI|nr:helix-turn-helix transcriptional regulator [Candidatus Rickettsiella viridis]BBB14613.1 peptidase S24-like domain protein [Candidatus Rickettsiella viridis]
MSSENKLNDILEYLMKEQRINTQQLHKHTGVSLSTLKRLRLNKENNPTVASLVPIAQYFNISVDQLIGIDPLEKNSRLQNEITVPIIEWENASNPQKDKCKQSFAPLLVTDMALSQHSYALLIKEQQWNNFLPGSLLIVDPHLTPNNRDFLIITEEKLQLPQLYQLLIFKSKLYLKTSDCASEIIPFTDNYKNLGVVIQIRMNYKDNKQHVNIKDEESSYDTQQY